jgi:uncharacterized repeat protein (TIGR04138 family)
MLCQKCQQREATYFITQIICGEMRRENLCEPCASPQYGSMAENSSRQPQNSVPQAATLGTRFPADAYRLVMDAVGAATASPEGTHKNAKALEIADAFRALARTEYGTDALAKLAGMRITTTDDVGTIVFDLVNRGILFALPEDFLGAFHDLYDFKEAFPVS